MPLHHRPAIHPSVDLCGMESAEQHPPPRWRRIRRIRKPPPQPQPQLRQHQQHKEKEKENLLMDDDNSTTAPTPISTSLFKSRKRFAMELGSHKMIHDTAETAQNGNEESTPSDLLLSERRKALFEPLEPNMNGKRPSAESLLPPPDFDVASYPKGWLIGKKRKLVNVDVVESMRRIAVQEMNRKDREIDGLNEQLEEDARVLEHLQIQLLQEKSKRSNVERENAMLQDHINMLMDMIHDDDENMGDDEP